MRPQSGLDIHAVASRRAKYRAPKLSLLGDVRTLTESGSSPIAEDSDGMQDSMCNGMVNMTGNMC